MRRYELMLVLRPDAPDERIAAIVDRTTRQITTDGGQIVKVAPWGRRRLAYPIARYREGSYHIIVFEAPAGTIVELERTLLITEEVLRHLVIRQERPAKAVRREAAAQLERYRELRAQGMVSQAALDERQRAFDSARASADGAEQRERLLEAGPRVETVRLYEEQSRLAAAAPEGDPVGRALSRLARAARGARAFTMPIGGFGAFPTEGRARVVWVGCGAVPALELLQHGVEKEYAVLGFPLEGRAFRPHLTLGRAKGEARGGVRGLAEPLARLGYPGEGVGRSGELMQSQLSPAGARYTARHTVPLATAP